MAKSFRLLIITPERTVQESDVTSIMAPGDLGYLGVLADHTPLITTLKQGYLEITDPNGVKSRMTLSGGIMEVFKNTVTILTDSIS